MSKKANAPKRDKRSKLDLDLFVLALLRRGIDTPYRLLASAGLSPGASIPVLRRLEQVGYVRPGKAGPRGRIEYHITTAGHHYLENEWQILLQHPVPTDSEAILRTAALAVLSGCDRRLVSTYLKKAAATKASDSKRRQTDAKTAEACLSGDSDANLYRWLRATHAAARLRAEGQVLRKLAAEITRRT